MQEGLTIMLFEMSTLVTGVNAHCKLTKISLNTGQEAIVVG